MGRNQRCTGRCMPSQALSPTSPHLTLICSSYMPDSLPLAFITLFPFFHYSPPRFLLKVVSERIALLLDACFTFFVNIPLQFFPHCPCVPFAPHFGLCLYYSHPPAVCLSSTLPLLCRMNVLIPAEYYISMFLVKAVKICCALEKLLSSPVICEVVYTK